MDFLSALLRAYEYCEEKELVDKHDGDKTVLLPLYHTNLRSSGTNIVEACLDKEGKLVSASFLPKDEQIIFPVSQDSIARSGKFPLSHPLIDKLSYLTNDNVQLHQMYLEESNKFFKAIKDPEVKNFVDLIKNFLTQENFFDLLLSKLYPNQNIDRDCLKVSYSENGKAKRVDFNAVFLTFKIIDFNGARDVSITENVDLHQEYVRYVEHLDLPKGFCNISGTMQQLTTKHRGLMGNAKLISVSNNTENYKGRFNKGEDIISIGYQTSEKIHLMLKYLLENNNSRKWLKESQYMINWFSDDISNESQLDYVYPSNSFLDELDDDAKNVVTEENKLVGQSFIKGRQEFSDDASYYVAIIDKASNGRISLKYFRELKVSRLFDNLKKWQSDNEWEYYDKTTKQLKKYVPSMAQMILVSYGIEEDKGLELRNESFFKAEFEKLITSLIDGKNVPDNILRAADQNIRQRLKYEKTWMTIQSVTLGLFHNKGKEELTPMLDREYTNRSYLYGRLLAVFERIEAATFGADEKRLTNAQKFWTSYTNQPAIFMETLIRKTSVYKRSLLQSNYHLFIKLDKEQSEIIQKINDNYYLSSEVNNPLDYNFIFGYYAENGYIFSKKESEE